MERFRRFIELVLLVQVKAPVVIFIDEIDSVLELPFSTDDFFAFIRACYHQRGDKPDYQRLTFCLLGVASPNDLMQNKQRTPFNIGRGISLQGIQLSEAAPLQQGLEGKVQDPIAVMAEILEWTGGQPFLTQKLCQLVVEHGQDGLPDVSQIVKERIIDDWKGQDNPVHLSTIEDRVCTHETYASRMLGLYQQILSEGAIEASGEDETQQQLQLTNLVVKEGGQLRVCNPIYNLVFNRDWTDATLRALRPPIYIEAFRAWRKAEPEQQTSFLLRGDALQEAETWAQDKRLSEEDERFLKACRAEENREVTQRLAAEQEANQILRVARLEAERAREQTTAEQKQTKAALAEAEQDLNQVKQETAKVKRAGRRNVVMTTLLALLIGGGSLVWAKNQVDQAAYKASLSQEAAAEAQDKAKEAKEETKKAKIEQGNAVKRINTAEQLRAAADKDRKAKEKAVQVARNLLTLARKKATKALARERHAQQNFRSAREQVQQAKGSLQQLNREKNLAIQLTGKAQQNLKYVQEQFAVEQAILTKVEEKLLIARQGTEAEQQGSRALQLFETNQSLALLKALNAGQLLQDIVYRRSKLEDVKLINQKLALSQYPAISPLTALQQILTFHPDLKWMREKPIPTRQAYVRKVSWSRDGKTLLAVGTHGDFSIWQQDGTLIHSFDTIHGSDRNVDWSGDGQTLTTIGDSIIKLWERDGTLIQAINTAKEVLVPAFVWSGDGQTLATGGTVGIVRLWQRDGTLIQSFGTKHSIESMSWSSDGQTLATIGDGIVKLWERDGTLIQSINTKRGSKKPSMSWSSNGQILATNVDGIIKLWQRDTPIQSIGTDQNCSILSWNDHDQTLATVCRDSIVKLWERDGTLIQSIYTNQGIITSMSWSGDGQTLATSGRDGVVKFWERDGTPIQSINTNQGTITSMSWSADSKTLVTVGDGIVKLWQRNETPIQSFDINHQGNSNLLGWSGDGQILATVGNGTVKLWQQDGTLIKSFDTEHPITSASWIKDGKILAIVDRGGIVKLWERDDTLIKSIDTKQDQANFSSWSGDGDTLAMGRVDGIVKLWERDGTLIKSIDTNHKHAAIVSLSDDGQTLATTSYREPVKLWERDGTLIKSINTTGQGTIPRMSWSGDGQILATVGNGIVKLWERDGTLIKSIYTNTQYSSMSWSGDGKILAIAEQGGTVKLVKQDGIPMQSFDTGHTFITRLIWSGDDQILATQGYSIIQFWQQDGTPIQSINLTQGSTSVSLSSDGQTLTSLGEDGTVKLWPIADLDTLLIQGCDWLNTYLIQTPEELRKLNVCQTPQRTLAAAPNLVEDSDRAAKSGKIDTAIEGYRTAEQWGLPLNFDPVSRAHKLADEVKDKNKR